MRIDRTMAGTIGLTLMTLIVAGAFGATTPAAAAEPAITAPKPLLYDAKRLLYGDDGTAYAEEELPAAFDAAFGRGKPVVLFIHGRGDEPAKSLQGGGRIVEGQAVRKIKAYGVSVLMLSWDSKRGGKPWEFRDRDRPLQQTPEAGRRIGTVLHALSAWLAEHPTHPPVTLLVHSMGTIALQRCLEGGGWPASERPLFASVVLSSADADDLGHQHWVEKIPASENVYVTFNPGDPALKISTESRAPGAVALGLGAAQDLADNARYVELHADPRAARRFKAHETFNKCVCLGHAQVIRFFHDRFHGKPSEVGGTGSRSALALDPARTGPLFAGAGCQ